MGSTLYRKQRKFIFSNHQSFRRVEEDDIIGMEPVKKKLKKIVASLKHFKAISGHGQTRIGCGTFFWGIEGTGKTTGACYIATKADAAFVDISKFPLPGEDNEEIEEPKWSRKAVKIFFALVKELVAKTEKPAVVFCDNFKTFLEESLTPEGRAQFLEELEGIEGRPSGIHIIAASIDRPEDFTDPEVFRPGRIYRRIHFYLPDREAQAEVLRHELGKRPHDKIDCDNIVYLLADPSPATLVHLVEEAHESVELERGEKAKITEQVLMDLFVDYRLQDEVALDHRGEVKFNIAIHDLCHALVGIACDVDVQFVSVRPGVSAFAETHIDDSWYANTRVEDLKNRIPFFYGGIAAEKVCRYNPLAMNDDDLHCANDMARELVERRGQGKRFRKKYGLMFVETEKVLTSAMQRLIDLDVADILKKNEAKAETILSKIGKKRIEVLAKILIDPKRKQPIMLRREINEHLQKILPKHLWPMMKLDGAA